MPLKPEILLKLRNYLEPHRFGTEITRYTEAGVSATPYLGPTGSAERPTWAGVLLGDPKPNGKNPIEFERTMTALYCLELLVEGGPLAYEDFIEAQKNLHRNDQPLPRQKFNAMSDQFKTFLTDRTDEPFINRKKLLEYIVIYSDLAKTPSVKEWAKAHSIDPQLGFDEIMLEILRKKNEDIFVENKDILSKSILLLPSKLDPLVSFPEDAEWLSQNGTVFQEAAAILKEHAYLLREQAKSLFEIDKASEEGKALEKKAASLSNNAIALSPVLPSFAHLTPEEKTKLRTYFPLMTACLGHLYFLEAAPQMLKTIENALAAIPEAEQVDALAFVIKTSQFLDGMGAVGNNTILGSYTCSENFEKGYNEAMFESMNLFLPNPIGKSSQVLEAYLLKRSEYMGAGFYKTDFDREGDYQVFMRLACKLRIFDSERAQELKEAYFGLSQDIRDLLSEQLNLSGETGIDSFRVAPNYEATGFMNITDKTKKLIAKTIEELDAAQKETLSQKITQIEEQLAVYVHQAREEEYTLPLNYAVCFAKIIREMKRHYPEICDSINPANFGALAFVAGQTPEIFDPATFSPYQDITPYLGDRDRRGATTCFLDLVLPKGMKACAPSQLDIPAEIPVASLITLGLTNSAAEKQIEIPEAIRMINNTKSHP